MQIPVGALCLSLAITSAFAQAAEPKIPAEQFVRPSAYEDAQLSPTGEYLSVVTPFEDRHALSLIKLSGNYDRNLIKFTTAKQTVAFAYWTDDTRLIVFKALDIGSLESPLLDGDVIAVDADGTESTQLFGYVKDSGHLSSRMKDQGNVSFRGNIPGSGGEALFEYSPWQTRDSDFVTSLYRVNTHTGKRLLVESVDDSVSMVADNGGKARMIWAEDMEGRPWLQYRPTRDSDEWKPVPKSLAGRTMAIADFEPDNNHATALISDDGGPAGLYRVDFSAGTRERLASNPDMDVADLMPAGYEGQPFAVGYDAGKPKIEFTNPGSEWAALLSGLMKLFPGELVEFVNFTKDNNKVLFFVHSDRHPGAYYIFDRKTRTPSMLFETREWVNPATQAPTQAVQFQNASGQTLYALYTAPLGKTGPQAMVVIPHGGPFGVHDAWSYDPQVQFLASRGYAVLQVNYRGSSGRGENFERSTYKQWGTGIQDDIRDGVRWAISQKLADSAKVCIFGASFGGYSALMNPILNPGMYKCAIGYAGVYDLQALSETKAERGKQLLAFFNRSMGSEKAMLASQSPSNFAAKLDVPVLLVHGRNDHNVPIEQYNTMSGALSLARKPYESLVKSNEGHGFYDVKNNIELYDRVEAFLLKYNPPN